jgi:hypothetical protein
MVGVAGDVAGAATGDLVGDFAEGVPDGGATAVGVGGSFNLVAEVCEYIYLRNWNEKSGGRELTQRLQSPRGSRRGGRVLVRSPCWACLLWMSSLCLMEEIERDAENRDAMVPIASFKMQEIYAVFPHPPSSGE